jgi:hypothetical protein
MVGDGGKVQRAIETDRLGAHPVGAQRRQQHRLALGEAIGLVGRGAHIERPGVERVGGVHVEVAEVNVAQGILVQHEARSSLW